MAAVRLHRHALPALLLVLLQLTVAASELHRAKHQRAFPRSGDRASPAPQAGLMEGLQEVFSHHQPWVLSVAGAALVGFSGILPLLVIPLETGARLKERGEYRFVRSATPAPTAGPCGGAGGTGVCFDAGRGCGLHESSCRGAQLAQSSRPAFCHCHRNQ